MPSIEICCVCGFVHKDDRIQSRSLKMHAHFLYPTGEEGTPGYDVFPHVDLAGTSYRFLPTVCLEHVVNDLYTMKGEKTTIGELFARLRALSPSEHRTWNPGSTGYLYNVGITDKDLQKHYTPTFILMYSAIIDETKYAQR